jgi:hypothetical protein
MNSRATFRKGGVDSQGSRVHPKPPTILASKLMSGYTMNVMSPSKTSSWARTSGARAEKDPNSRMAKTNSTIFLNLNDNFLP